MPNWAECRLWVDGDDKMVADFYSKLIVDDELDYSILVPITDDGTYDYGMANFKWGTKWCGSDVVVVDEKQVEFYSPWSGPDEFISTVSKMYPELIFELTVIEAGMDFSYKNVYKNGSCSEIDGGTFTVLCNEFGYQICEVCDCVLGWSCDCVPVEDEEEVMA